MFLLWLAYIPVLLVAVIAFAVQDGSELAGTNLIERLENELVAQTAALDSLLNAGGKRGRKQADLPLIKSQVSFFCLQHNQTRFWFRYIQLKTLCLQANNWYACCVSRLSHQFIIQTISWWLGLSSA